jgi:hypothetical protein
MRTSATDDTQVTGNDLVRHLDLNQGSGESLVSLTSQPDSSKPISAFAILMCYIDASSLFIRQAAQWRTQL